MNTCCRTAAMALVMFFVVGCSPTTPAAPTVTATLVQSPAATQTRAPIDTPSPPMSPTQVATRTPPSPPPSTPTPTVSNSGIPSAIEFEALGITEKHDVTPSIQDMSAWGAQRWSGGKQLLVSARVGSSIRFVVRLDKVSAYTLRISATQAPDYGQIQVALDDLPLGKPIDLYAPTVRPTGPIVLGTLDLATGNHVLTFSVVGKNAGSRDLKFALDTLSVTPPNVVLASPAAPKDDRFVMPITNTLPWGAVGFIDNGCTGTLIDRQHVLAAAHCFIYDWNNPPFQHSDWQTGLVFFPNYHPNVVNPPRVPIDRMVVGRRPHTGVETAGFDWGIAHLSKPVDDFPALPIQPVTLDKYPLLVTYAGYAREGTIFPLRYPQPSPGGYCKYFGGNCWWIPALVEPSCRINNATIRLDPVTCQAAGGNSGSPIIWNVGSLDAPVYRIMGVIGSSPQANAARFVYAPRLASSVALATANDGSARTQVFATDADFNRIVSRTRETADSSSNFVPFDLVGADLPSVPRRLTAFTLRNGKPALAVVAEDENLYASHADNTQHWQAWIAMDKPSGVTGFLDVASAYDANGQPQLYVIASNHAPYGRVRLSNDPDAGWENWQPLLPAGSGAFNRIVAIRRDDGTPQVFLVSTARDVFTLTQTAVTPNSSWSAPTRFTSANQPAVIAELAANLTEDSQVQLFATDGQGALWTRAMRTRSGNDGWNEWERWQVALFAPLATEPRTLTDLVSLTAGQWQEPLRGDRVPVVFATDRQGNIYLTTHSGNQGWQSWRSFY